MKKLVRDKIPEIISRRGDKVNTERLNSDSDYEYYLNLKLDEEIAEFRNINSSLDSLEEMADIFEVLYSICRFKNIDLEELEDCRIKKRMKRGGFDSRILLIKE